MVGPVIKEEDVEAN